MSDVTTEVRSYKFRIYPTKVQEQQMLRTFGCTRVLWNLMLADAQNSYRDTKKFSYQNPAAYKLLGSYSFLSEVDSMALCNVQINFSNALQLFLRDRKNTKKRHKTRFPRIKRRKTTRRSYTTSFTNNNIQIVNGKLKLPKLGLVEIVLHRHVMGKIKNVTVSQDPSGKFYASIATERQKAVSAQLDCNNIVGLDFSFNHLIVTNEGARLKWPDWLRQVERRLVRAQRWLARRQEGSNRYEDQRLRVAKLHEYIRFRRLDVLRKVAKRLLDRHDVIVVEDIDLVSLSRKGRRRRFGATIAALGFGILRNLLQDGAAQRGKQYVVADRWFPSSQRCSGCGQQNSAVKNLAVKEWTCPNCGQHHDRDVNAAQNLVKWYFEHQESSTGAVPGIHAEGEIASTFGVAKRMRSRRTRKSHGAVDPVSPALTLLGNPTESKQHCFVSSTLAGIG